MTTTNTALDSVIEHATETTKAAGERAREFARIGVRKATEAKYWRGRLETRIAQAQDLGAYVRKAADDAVRPVQERIEKFTKAAA
jgi:hypothetical protein